MAQAILLPLVEKGDFSVEEIFGVVGNQTSVQRVLNKFPSGLKVVAADDPLSERVWEAPIKLLAIKPQQLNDFHEQIIENKQKSCERPVLISLLAGVNLSHLQKIFPGLLL